MVLSRQGYRLNFVKMKVVYNIALQLSGYEGLELIFHMKCFIE